jgi:hypothetical protein
MKPDELIAAINAESKPKSYQIPLENAYSPSD